MLVDQRVKGGIVYGFYDLSSLGRLLGWCIWGRYVAIVQRHRFAVGRGWTWFLPKWPFFVRKIWCAIVLYNTILGLVDKPYYTIHIWEYCVDKPYIPYIYIIPYIKSVEKMGNPQFLTISNGESSYFLSTNCQKGLLPAPKLRILYILHILGCTEMG
jgi:hypothetical protein